MSIQQKRQNKGHPLRQARRDRAAARQADVISNPTDRLAVLDLRFGAGKGAQRERARLAAML